MTTTAAEPQRAAAVIKSAALISVDAHLPTISLLLRFERLSVLTSAGPQLFVVVFCAGGLLSVSY